MFIGRLWFRDNIYNIGVGIDFLANVSFTVHDISRSAICDDSRSAINDVSRSHIDESPH